MTLKSSLVGLDGSKHSSMSFGSLNSLGLIKRGDNVKGFKAQYKNKSGGLVGSYFSN